MKYTKVLLLVILSVSFSNPLKGLYASYDLDVEATLVDDTDGDELTFDFSGGLQVGYDYSIAGAVHVGASFDVLKMVEDTDLYDSDVGFINIYGKYSYAISGMGNAWGSIGYNLPQGDFGGIGIEWGGGISVGLGYTSPFGLGASMTVHNLTNPTYEGEDIDDVSAYVTRMSVYYQF